MPSSAGGVVTSKSRRAGPGPGGYDGDGPRSYCAGGAAGLKDLSDYMAYNLSTFGHANAGEGLCVVERKYPSPQ